MKRSNWITPSFVTCLLALLVSMVTGNTVVGAHTLQAAGVASFQRGVDGPGTDDTTTSITLPEGKWLVTGTITAQNTSSAGHVTTCVFNPPGDTRAIATSTVAASSQQTITLNDTFDGPISLSLSCRSDGYPATDMIFSGVSLMIAPVKK
jgi:hypothetical protein